MAWRKKTLALICILALISVLYLQEYVYISEKLSKSTICRRLQGYWHSHSRVEQFITRAMYKENRLVIEKPSAIVNANAVVNDENAVVKHPKRGVYTIIRYTPEHDGLEERKGFMSSYHDFDIPIHKRIYRGDVALKQKSVLNSESDGDIDSSRDVPVVTEHAQRIETLRSGCQDAFLYRKGEQRKGNLSDFFYSRAHNFAYCKVPKSGSTFWMKLFTILMRGDNYSKQISQMSRADIHTRSMLFVTDPGRVLRNKIPTVIASRNPFSRLYSAYVDKVYIPLFWYQFQYMENVTVLDSYYNNGTVEVLKSSNTPLSSRLYKYRDRLREKGLLIKKNITQKITPVCANNATFEAFLRFIISEIKSGRSLEPHWAPISHLCHPCKFNTYKIVKQESFSVDVEHTLRSVGVDISKHEWLRRSLNENRAENSAPGIIAVIQSKYKQMAVKRCMSQSEISKRLWKSFQIQGFISKEIQFQESLLNDDWNSGSNKMTQSVLDAISQKVMTSSERSKQREYYLKQAYNSVSADTIASIQDIYYLDFILFNYSSTPP